MQRSESSSIARVLTVVFAALSGLYLLGGGVWLAASGGSIYYVVAGIFMLITAVLVQRRKPLALGLYALLLLGTIGWSLWEVGTDFWALTPRLGVLVIFGIWLLLPFVYRRFESPAKTPGMALGATLIVSGVVLVYAVFNDPQELNGTLGSASAPAAAATATSTADGDWPAYGRTQHGTRYSPLNQINAENVKNLQEAWTFRTGDTKRSTDPGEITDEVTPIKVGDLLYLCSPHQILFALDAATGQEKWRFDPKLKTDPSFQHVTCRGVSYHDLTAAGTADNGQPQAPPAAPAMCARRIYLPVNNGHLYALDALSGQLCPDFASHGDLDLQVGQPVTTAGQYEPTSPPVITDKVIVIAGAVEDNYSTREPSGVIRGFDVATGKLLWAFDPGAKDPGTMPGLGQRYSINSPNSWAPSVYDAKLDLVYLPMGVTTPDIWGGNRTPEQERFASGLLALNATTGKLAWFYQTVHHDLWDMDLPSQPTFADITDQSGNTVPVVYAPAKTGNIFVLDRRTGKLVVPAPETPVPQGAAPGDHVSPTQPFSALTFRPRRKADRRRHVGRDDVRPARVPRDVPAVSLRRHVHAAVGAGHARVPRQPRHVRVGRPRRRYGSTDRDREPDRAAVRIEADAARSGQSDRAGQRRHAGSGTESGIQPQYGVPYGVELNPVPLADSACRASSRPGAISRRSI